MSDYSKIKLLAFSIDGTLTDGTTWWGGDESGWLQSFSVRDGRALQRLRSRMHVVPLSSNTTDSAARWIADLGLDGRWVGVSDKVDGLQKICTEHIVRAPEVCFVGDGPDDVAVLRAVGWACAVADAHPDDVHVAIEHALRIEPLPRLGHQRFGGIRQRTIRRRRARHALERIHAAQAHTDQRSRADQQATATR